MKGIVLAGGSGTRLYPATLGISKQLMAVYDKPMVYYPLSVLMLAGIRDILIITTPQDLELFKRLLGDGSGFGANLTYCVQETPNGLAQAFVLGQDHIGTDSVCLILGDNIFYGQGLAKQLKTVGAKVDSEGGCQLFGYRVNDPERYGVAQVDSEFRIISIVEKPEKPLSNLAVTGLYLYDNSVVERAKKLEPSVRGEYEITDLNQAYVEESKAGLNLLGRGMAWLDTGTHDSLLEASTFVQVLAHRQSLQIACLEEIGFENGWIDVAKLREGALKYGKSGYGAYLTRVADASDSDNLGDGA